MRHELGPAAQLAGKVLLILSGLGTLMALSTAYALAAAT